MEALEAAGIRANGAYGGKMRLVTRWQVDPGAIDRDRLGDPERGGWLINELSLSGRAGQGASPEVFP